jgi:glutamate-1-semialdehyde 2,1-aminomutase
MVENDGYDHVTRLGEKLRAGLTDIIADHVPEYTVVGRDSLFKLVFTRDGDYDVSCDNGSQSSVCEGGCRQRRRHAHALMPVRKPEPR